MLYVLNQEEYTGRYRLSQLKGYEAIITYICESNLLKRTRSQTMIEDQKWIIMVDGFFAELGPKSERALFLLVDFAKVTTAPNPLSKYEIGKFLDQIHNFSFGKRLKNKINQSLLRYCCDHWHMDLFDFKEWLRIELSDYLETWCFKPSGFLQNIFHRNQIHIEAIKDVMNQNYWGINNEMEDDISVLNLSLRAENCLRRAGISTVQKLMDTPTEDIVKVRNMGKRCAEETIQQLNVYLANQDISTYRFHLTKKDHDYTLVLKMSAWNEEELVGQVYDELFPQTDDINFLNCPWPIFPPKVTLFLLMQGYLYYQDVFRDVKTLDALLNQLGIMEETDYLSHRLNEWFVRQRFISEEEYEALSRLDKITEDKVKTIQEAHQDKMNQLFDRIQQKCIDNCIDPETLNACLDETDDFMDLLTIASSMRHQGIRVERSLSYYIDQVEQIAQSCTGELRYGQFDRLMVEEYNMQEDELYQYIIDHIDSDYRWPDD